MTSPISPLPVTVVRLDGFGWSSGASVSSDPSALFSGTRLRSLAETAVAAGFDVLAFDDSFRSAPGRAEDLYRPDAVLAASYLAPLVADVGLLCTVTSTYTEPFHVAKALATLDHVSGGRAGWSVQVSTTAGEAAAFGRGVGAPTEDEAWREAIDVASAVSRLWDSWDDDAVVRDVEGGRYIDSDRLHYVNFTGATFSVRGPSTTPRPPQGRLPIVVPALSEPALACAAAVADIIVVTATDAEEARSAQRAARTAVRDTGRSDGEVRVMLSISLACGPADPSAAPELVLGIAPASFSDAMADLAAATGADGILVRLADLERDLEALAAARPVPHHQVGHRTLRERFGLLRPTSLMAAGEAVGA